ncbi:hypothetical protein CSKR_102727 [Clonorchis sinensis]|uniref:Uncharacterized protein n=1 Tax=Clonorchis sinensis TaxID=79923 RepID=A0A3R7GMN9_CLOSI|nr:hypothetical protein CSKR_102727 [Clonorchis sinensis]
MVQWLEREFTDRKVRGWNPTSAPRLPLSRFGRPGSIPALMLPSGGMAVRRLKSVTAEWLFTHYYYCNQLEHEAAWCSTFSCLKTSQTGDSAGFQNIRLTETRGLRLPDEPQEGRNRSWAVEEFSATL